MAIKAQGIATWQLVCQNWHMSTGKSHLPGPLSAAIARIVQDAIATRGLPQVRVAEAASISASQLSRILSGIKVFTLEELDRVCVALDVDISDVVSQADEETREERRGLGNNVIVGRFGENAQPIDDRRVAFEDDGDDGADQPDN